MYFIFSIIYHIVLDIPSNEQFHMQYLLFNT
jgi:hypothetical protein